MTSTWGVGVGFPRTRDRLTALCALAAAGCAAVQFLAAAHSHTLRHNAHRRVGQLDALVQAVVKMGEPAPFVRADARSLKATTVAGK